MNKFDIHVDYRSLGVLYVESSVIDTGNLDVESNVIDTGNLDVE